MPEDLTEVADVFRRYGDHYCQQFPISPEQLKVLNLIKVCRTTPWAVTCTDVSTAATKNPLTTLAATDTVPSAKRWPRKSGSMPAGPSFCPAGTSTWSLPCPTS